MNLKTYPVDFPRIFFHTNLLTIRNTTKNLPNQPSLIDAPPFRFFITLVRILTKITRVIALVQAKTILQYYI